MESGAQSVGRVVLDRTRLTLPADSLATHMPQSMTIPVCELYVSLQSCVNVLLT